jgi:very-short-patch-repair endonuclease
LSYIDTLQKWKAPSELKAKLSDGGTLDRKALGIAAETLAAQIAAFNTKWTDLLREFAVVDANSVLAKQPQQLLGWLDSEAIAIEKETAALTRIVALLAPEKDLATASLKERCESLQRLVEARSQIATAAATLQETRTPETLESTDHTAEAEKAKSLLAFLAAWAKPVSPQLAGTLSKQEQREKLRAVTDRSAAAHVEFDKAWERLAELFAVNANVSTHVVLEDTPFDQLRKWATARAADVERLGEWSRFLQVEKDAAAFGITAVLDEVKAGEFSALEAADAFRARFYRLWLDALHAQVPALAAFSTDNHERSIDRFAELDRLAIRSTPNLVRGQMFASQHRPRNRDGAPDTSELGILLREANKKRRHLPLRELFKQIPTILPRLKPCLMMSPLAVSTYLDTPELSFDVVIFDEASQVRPHDAVCAIYRGKQLVVGGDPRQLPPTDFFNRGTDDEADTDDLSANFESLLDVCVSLGLPRKRLRWHYRSRREGLIAFANRYIYEGRLVTFPSADEATSRAVTFERVPDGRFKDGVNSIEAKRVAALVLEHARTKPDRSLGVIAFSQKQQDRILDELEVLRRQHTDTEPFFADDRQDPFFVKNLENVQGDERDVIFLSVGYGPDDSGKVAMRFGPLNRTGGERRLNVAVTRARGGMCVVASMIASDIDLSRTNAEGAKMLKAFLDYAERGPVALAAAITEANQGGADSPFEQEVGEELVRRGLSVHRQVGCGGYLIDMAITDPQQGGKYLLGVECDGATYHSAATARDRDRLRQAVLEGLGWRLVRVWSSDWVRDREKQVRRVLAALEAAKQPRPERREEDLPAPPAAPRVQAKTPEYDSIEAVPEPALGEAITGSLLEFGAMPAEDLIAAVSKRLGFRRTGPKIRERIAEVLNTQMSSNRLSLGTDERVRLVKPQ